MHKQKRYRFVKKFPPIPFWIFVCTVWYKPWHVFKFKITDDFVETAIFDGLDTVLSPQLVHSIPQFCTWHNTKWSQKPVKCNFKNQKKPNRESIDISDIHCKLSHNRFQHEFKSVSRTYFTAADFHQRYNFHVKTCQLI